MKRASDDEPSATALGGGGASRDGEGGVLASSEDPTAAVIGGDGAVGGGASGAADESAGASAQVRVDNLSTWATTKEVRQRLESTLGVKGIKKIKKQVGQDFAFVYFEDGPLRLAAEPLISGHQWRGQELYLRQAIPLDPDRFKAKRQRRDEDGAGGQLKSAADAVTPLHAMAYSEQLVVKRKGLVDVLKKLPQDMKHAQKSVGAAQQAAWRSLAWLDPDRIKANGGIPCPLAEVLPAPRVNGK